MDGNIIVLTLKNLPQFLDVVFGECCQTLYLTLVTCDSCNCRRQSTLVLCPSKSLRGVPTVLTQSLPYVSQTLPKHTQALPKHTKTLPSASVPYADLNTTFCCPSIALTAVAHLLRACYTPIVRLWRACCMPVRIFIAHLPRCTSPTSLHIMRGCPAGRCMVLWM